MNILHYSIGLYPDRSGGLVRYSTDLAMEQSKDNEIYYLMPGKLGLVDRNVKIVETKTNDIKLKVFKIYNALPIPIYSGIKDVGMYTRPTSVNIFVDFFEKHAIEIVYVHSLMGLHKEFLQAANDCKIRVVMITHDFFGICPITTLLKNGEICTAKAITEKCYECSSNAHSYIKLAVGQSAIYKYLKSANKIKSIRNRVLSNKDTKEHSCSINNEKLIRDYMHLNDYYLDCYRLVDFFVFNSSQTREVYLSRLRDITGTVINLLHSGIHDFRKQRRFFKDGILHIGFMGECTEFKGYDVLRSAVEKLYRDGFKVELDVYNDSVIETEFIKKKGKYKSSDLEKIYDSLDIIVVPSICYETLSFSALEAISFAMPCIVSDRVGAKDFIENNQTGFVVENGDCEVIRNILVRMLNDQNVLCEINKKIVDGNYSFDFAEHCKKLMKTTIENYSEFTYDSVI